MGRGKAAPKSPKRQEEDRAGAIDLTQESDKEDQQEATACHRMAKKQGCGKQAEDKTGPPNPETTRPQKGPRRRGRDK